MEIPELDSGRSLSSLKGIIKNRRVNMKTRMIAWLEYTVRFYTLDNRAWCMDKQGCVYHPVPEVSPGCAIGQMLSREMIDELGGTSPGIQYVLKWYPGILDMHDRWLLDFDPVFLQYLQKVHDAADNFNINTKLWSLRGWEVIGELLYYVKQGRYN